MRDVTLLRMYDFYKKENSVEQNVRACGLNTGNVIWYESVRDTIQLDTEIRIQECNNVKGACIIPMANHLSIYTSALEDLAEMLKTVKKIVIIGLGSQLTEELNTPKKLVEALSKERKRAILNLSEKTISIGIRGETTAECLDLIGVKNHKVIGCPSFYSNKDAIFKLCHEKDKNNSKLCINLASYGKKQVSYFINAIKKEKGLSETFYVMQDMRDMPRTLYEECPVLPRHIKDKFPESDLTSEEWTDYIRKCGKIFFQKGEWINFFEQEKIECSVGLRFHGNMAALLAGVPTVWITHDSRTRELCQAMKLPNYDIDKITPQFGLEKVYDCLDGYNISFWNEYVKLFDNYQLFLKENEIENREVLV